MINLFNYLLIIINTDYYSSPTGVGDGLSRDEPCDIKICSSTLNQNDLYWQEIIVSSL